LIHHYHHHHLCHHHCHHHKRANDHHALFGTKNKAELPSEPGTGTTASTRNRNRPRRDFISSMIASSSFIMATNSNTKAALAAEAEIESESATQTTTETKERKKPNFTQQEIASFLHPIPSFAIVDQAGVPYMVVGEDAKLSAYFFTTYEEARRILDVASESADRAIRNLREEEEAKRRQNNLPPLSTLSREDLEDIIGVNPWKSFGGARISSLPLDFSVSLASRGKVAGSYFRIAPAEDDIREALEIETSIEELSEGKVPLFYIDDYEISDGSQIPLYFQKSQLLKDYKKFSGEKPPVVQVTELFSILGQMAGTGEIDDDLKKLVLVPPKGSIDKAKLCEKKRGKASPYKIGERIVVL